MILLCRVSSPNVSVPWPRLLEAKYIRHTATAVTLLSSRPFPTGRIRQDGFTVDMLFSLENGGSCKIRQTGSSLGPSMFGTGRERVRAEFRSKNTWKRESVVGHDGNVLNTIKVEDTACLLILPSTVCLSFTSQASHVNIPEEIRPAHHATHIRSRSFGSSCQHGICFEPSYL